MSISAMNKGCRARALWFLGFAVFCLVFHLVYTCFSHGIRSPFMTYLWAIPLTLGTVVYAICGLLLRDFPVGAPTFLYNAGVSTLTVGSLVLGILEIADASSVLMMVYPVVGGILFVSGIVLQALALRRGRQKK